MRLGTQGDVIERWDAKQYLKDPTIGTPAGVFGNMKCIAPATVVVSNIVRTSCHPMFKHLIDWVASFLEQSCCIDKFKQLLVETYQYPGLGRLNMRYTNIMQISEKEMMNLQFVSVAVGAVTRSTY
jgi:hypothetical protein